MRALLLSSIKDALAALLFLLFIFVILERASIQDALLFESRFYYRVYGN